MKSFFRSLLVISQVIIILSACTVNKKPVNNSTTKIQIPGPQAIIYTTKSDYSKLVPVIMSPDKKTIISYPDVKDLYVNGQLAYPTKLHNGYYLDNRGISLNVAFLKLTYEQYAALPKTPSSDELMKMILVKKPLKKMYSCGLRSKYTQIEEELNKAIDSDDFSKFTRLK